MADTRTVKLTHPIEFGKEAIEELEFRRGRLGDLKGIELKDSSVQVDDLLRIAARLSGRPQKVIDKLDEEDAEEVIDIALGFIERVLGTGSGGRSDS